MKPKTRRLLGTLVPAIALAVVLGGAAYGLEVRRTSEDGPRHPVAELPQPVEALAPAPPSAQRVGPDPDLRVPVLMYHQFGSAPDAAAAPYFTDPADFVEQLRYLQSHGYQAVTLQQVHDYWYAEGTLPERPVVITVDDGNTEVFTLVAPLLKSIGWPGVLCVLTGESPGRTTMGASQIRALVRAGWEIDSHSINHPDLTTLSSEELAVQMSLSRQLLQREFGVRANFFCYPYGKVDARVARAAQDAGYVGAVCTSNGVARSGNPYAMKRVFVRGGESIAAFAASLD